MTTRSRLHLLVAISIAFLAAPTGGRAHDFEETRRLVLSVDGGRIELLVAYEVRPGRVADALRARYDAGDDGVVSSGIERLARAQTIGPRLRHGITLVADGRRVPLAAERLAFPTPPDEGGRRGVAAVALYSAPLHRAPSPDRPLELVVRARGARGSITLEAQAADGYEMTAAGLESRSGDPVLGPGVLSSSEAIRLTVSAAAR